MEHFISPRRLGDFKNQFQTKIIAPINDDLSVQRKRLHNLEAAAQGKIMETQVDDDEAYQKTVPSGALDYARLTKWSGKSFVWNQLVDFSSESGRTADGLTITVNVQDGSASWTGTASSLVNSSIISYKSPVTPSHKYLAIRGGNVFADDNLQSGLIVQDANNSVVHSFKLNSVVADIFTISDASATKSYFQCLVKQGASINETFYPRLIDLTKFFGAGNEPSSVDSPLIQSLIEYVKNHPTFNSGEVLSAQLRSVVSKDSDNAVISTKTLPSGLPELHSAGSVSDTIDWVDCRAIYTKRVGVVDMGTLNWNYDRNALQFKSATSLTNAALVAVSSEVPNILCSKYGAVAYSGSSAWVDKTFSLIGSWSEDSAGRIWIKDTGYTDATAFKTAMNGVQLYYELDTPVETDITDLLGADNTLRVESGGTVTMGYQTALADMHVPIQNTEEYEIDLPLALETEA